MGLSSYSGLIRHLDLFAGSGMFGVACRIALGEWIRTVCYVERESYAQANLVARMEDAALDNSPEWDDVRTFGPKQIAEATSGVDLITAGFPCQDLSCAGRRAGFEGERSSLFFEILRIAADCACWFDGQWPVLFLENVPGIFSTRTARVFDDPFGARRVDEVWSSVCEEIACSIVGRELAAYGYDSVWLPVAAEDVGANHKRKRWFCLAYAKDSDGWGKLKRPAGNETHRSSSVVGHAEGESCRQGRAEYEGFGGAGAVVESGGALADGKSDRRGGVGVSTRSGGQGEGKRNASGASAQLADSANVLGEEVERGEPDGDGGFVLPIFAPHRFDKRWGEIIARRPDVEPAVRGSVDGLDSRVDRIRLCGGGVVPLAAAVAFGILVDYARGMKGRLNDSN